MFVSFLLFPQQVKTCEISQAKVHHRLWSQLPVSLCQPHSNHSKASEKEICVKFITYPNPITIAWLFVIYLVHSEVKRSLFNVPFCTLLHSQAHHVPNWERNTCTMKHIETLLACNVFRWHSHTALHNKQPFTLQLQLLLWYRWFINRSVMLSVVEDPRAKGLSSRTTTLGYSEESLTYYQ